MLNFGVKCAFLLAVSAVLASSLVAQTPVETRLTVVENNINSPKTGLTNRVTAIESVINDPNDKTKGLAPEMKAVADVIKDPKDPSKGLGPRLATIEKAIIDPTDKKKGLVPQLKEVEDAIKDPVDPDKGLSPQLQHLEKLVSDPNTGLKITSDTLKRLWVLLAAVLVFFMQAGFKCLEVGLGRRRHEGTIGIMNLMNWLILCVIFYCFGFGLMFGTQSWHGVIGTNLFFPSAEDVEKAYQPLGLGLEYLLFQLAFAATAATIVDGAIAERTALQPYMLATALAALFVYSIFGHWAWNDLGWLKVKWLGVMYKDASNIEHFGFHDFAGSTVVHSVGAWIALAATWAVGPRRFFRPQGPSRFAPYSVGYAVLGVIMLWFGWWGFNGGSLLKYDSTIASIILHTNLAGACAGLTSYIHALRRGNGNVYGKTIGGTLGGLVAITACCDVVTPISAMLIGATAGVVHNWALDFLANNLEVDDVAGAIPVHGACGVWGTFCTGIVIWWFHHGSPWQIVVQLGGIAVALGFALSVSYAIYFGIERWMGLRVSVVEEDAGRNTPMLGPYAGNIRVSVLRREWGFWSKFESFDNFMNRRKEKLTVQQAQEQTVASLRAGQLQIIRDNDLEATPEDMEQAVSAFYR